MSTMKAPTASSLTRYGVSVLWRLDSNWEVKDVWYGRTVIRSTYKLAYEVPCVTCLSLAVGTTVMVQELDYRLVSFPDPTLSSSTLSRVIHATHYNNHLYKPQLLDEMVHAHTHLHRQHRHCVMV